MLTLSGQVPKSPPMPVTTGVLPAHNGLFPGQAELAAAPEALPPEALPAPLSTPPVQKQPLASLDELGADSFLRSEEHTSELQSLMRISYAVFCLKKKKHKNNTQHN